MSDRQTCTKESPMPKGDPGRWQHSDCESVSSRGDFQFGQEFDTYRCRNCGKVFEVEVPQ